jgi:gluconokinase
MKAPRSVYDQAGGMAYFPRMLDKIRLYAAGELDSAYHANLGKGADARCLDYLRVRYDDLRARTMTGGTDEEILAWCMETGRALTPGDLTIWNGFITKLGWNDFASDYLRDRKREAGLEDREDIQTMPQLFDVEEGRR